MFKYSKAITAKIRSWTSNTTLLADDGQNCVSLEHLMITTSKSPKFNNQAWLPMYSKTQYTGNPFLYPAMQSKSIQLFAPNNSQTLSEISTIFGKINVSFTIIISLRPSYCWLKPQQFNCIFWTRTKAQNNTQIFALLTHAPQSSAGWQSGKYHLRLRRGHSPNTPNKTSSEQQSR